MPYIVTTYIDVHGDELSVDRTARRAVAIATLEEARNFVIDATVSGYIGASGVYDLPALGGTIGPLPDGTVIVVEQVGYDTLAHRAGFSGRGAHEDAEVRLTGPQIVAAYNAREAHDA